MFGKITALSLSTLFFSAAAVSYFCVRLCDADVPFYKKLVQESVELRSKRALERHPARQQRKDVQKDIWTVSGKERPHFRLKSEESDLIIKQRKDKFEATEHLHRLECCAQEELDEKENRQQIRYLNAESGTYFYPSHRFLAETVKLAFYRLPGNELPSSRPDAAPFLRGTASQVSFSTAGRSPQFCAHQLCAELNPEQGLP